MEAKGVSGRRLAIELGVTENAVRAAVKAGRIPKLPDGTFDVDACRAAWIARSDPAKSHVRPPAQEALRKAAQCATAVAQPPIRSEDEARQAIALIGRILDAEGIEHTEGIDFNSARTADTILKAYERDLKIAQRRKELVPLAKVQEHVSKAFIGLRQAIQRIPSRHVPAIAAKVGCDPSALDAALNRAIAAELNDLSSPVVRG